MSTQLSVFAQGFNPTSAALPDVVRQYGLTDEMQQGIGTSFAVVSIKGKTFSIKYGGTDNPLMVSANGATFAAPFFDVVMVAASANLTKTYYKDGYVDGSDASPDCWSEDSITPAAPTPVSSHCQTCPMNVFGSKVGPAGQKLKACSDSRKVIVVPAHDIENADYGGPMLLRVPAASLGPLADYAKGLSAAGVPFFAVVTRVQFDANAAYPKLQAQAIRALSPEDAARVIELRNSDRVAQILLGSATTAPARAPALAAPVAPAAPAAVAAPAPVVVAAPAPVVAAPPRPVPAPPAPPSAPVAPAFPPAGWTAHPDAPGYFYRGAEVLTEADLRALEAACPAVPAPPAPPAPPSAPVAPAPTVGAIPLDSSFMAKVDNLLGSLPK